MGEIIAILKKAFFSSIIITVLLSIIMYLRGYPAEISFVIKYISPQDSARLLTTAVRNLNLEPKNGQPRLGLRHKLKLSL